LDVIGWEKSAVNREPLSKAIRDERLAKAYSYLNQNFAETCAIAEVARAAGASERTLARLAADELCMSPSELLRQIRMEKAQYFLSQGYNVTETALMVGYQSLSQFGRAFQAVTGKLPSDYLVAK
jgi:AraC-like DNA-binding protein